MKQNAVLQAPKNFELTDLPKNIKLNEKFKHKNAEYVFEEIDSLNYVSCADIEDETPVGIETCYRVRKV